MSMLFDEGLLLEDCTTAETIVRLRRLTLNDAPVIAAALSDVAVARNLTQVPHPYGLDDAEAWLKSVAGHRDMLAAGVSVDGALAGVVAIDASGATPELGYWLAAPFQGRGVGRLAVRAFVDFAFATTDLATIAAGHMLDNPASGRLLERLGFQPTGETDVFSKARGATVRLARSTLARAAWVEGQPAIETPRLSLRMPTRADVAELARAAEAPFGLATAPFAELAFMADAQAFVLRAAREMRPTNLSLILRLKEDRTVVGGVGWRSVEPGVVELGFWLGAAHRGRGLMVEAARATLEAAFLGGGAKAARANCRASDWASRQVLIRCGFQWEGSTLVRPASGGSLAADRFRLDRDTFLSFREWAAADVRAFGG
ncbi:GNAT family N-acetyltransferase [Methylopila sp. 73B]|uniref:GNAT family N-acetyltransferase n=1 Tax=Methylopila sp. 73B TaxID=1120792 RepID=UPI0003765AE9|nr:GNAT family N-acetyltransferase [Methylopila sp. 73B]